MSDEFTQHIFEILIAKLAQKIGFTSISSTALNVLVDVAIDRLSNYASHSARFTTHSGRTDTNGIDVFAALSNYHETPETLSDYINHGQSLPPFEFLVEPYPLPRLSKFYTTSNQSNQKNMRYDIPFRANMGIFHESNNRQVPNFFPPMPTRYTYDNVMAQDPMIDDQEMIKKHENDQNMIQQSLVQILAGRGTDQPHAVHFDSELTRLVSNALISKPTNMLESPIYSIDRTKPDVDPEFLPLLDVTDETFNNEGQRDIQSMIQILSIAQGENEPGTIKKSTSTNQNSSYEKTPEKPLSPSSS